jgi:hypothetical protein
MSQQNPIRLFVTHAWQDSDDYLRLFEFLESARNFFYKNTGTPEQKPAGDTDSQRETCAGRSAPQICHVPGLFASIPTC